MVELETVLVDLKERVAREETGLDKQLTDLKSQLGQLRSQKQVSQVRLHFQHYSDPDFFSQLSRIHGKKCRILIPTFFPRFIFIIT